MCTDTRVGDEPLAIAAAIRVRRAVENVERAAIAIGLAQIDQHALASDTLRNLQAIAYPLLARVPTQLTGLVATRRFLARFNVARLDHLRGRDGIIDAANETIEGVSLEHVDARRARLTGATLRDVHAGRGMLEELDAEAVTLLRLEAVAATMRQADLRSCLAEHCDFSQANLARSNWRDASVFWCAFSGAALVDLLCDDALFVECDFRGADLSAVNLGARATSVGARFVRCDLRETRWSGRDLGGVTFIDCRMHGLVGPALATDASIVRPDMSPMGDGSATASAREIAESWKL
jgi:uncharacterized protein YjbI with pentapeptide repeats